MDTNLDSYEYLEVDATVINLTDWDMDLVTSHLEWGKFDEGHSPISVPKKGKMSFTARGRSASPSGTEGYAVWTLKNHPESPQIKAYFCNPAIGSSQADIECKPNCISVSVKSGGGKKFVVTYIVG